MHKNFKGFMFTTFTGPKKWRVTLYTYCLCIGLGTWNFVFRWPGFRGVGVGRLYHFFRWVGRQNDYGFTGMGAPYSKPHFWKTRFGISTAWGLAGILAEPVPDVSQPLPPARPYPGENFRQREKSKRRIKTIMRKIQNLTDQERAALIEQWPVKAGKNLPF